MVAQGYPRHERATVYNIAFVCEGQPEVDGVPRGEYREETGVLGLVGLVCFSLCEVWRGCVCWMLAVVGRMLCGVVYVVFSKKLDMVCYCFCW